MRPTDYRIYGDKETLDRLQEEYEDYVGRRTRREENVLIVLALPPRKRKEKLSSPEHRSKREREFGKARE